MLSPKQFKRWQHLISDCKSDQQRINVGGKAVREMLIAADEVVTAEQNREVEQKAAMAKLAAAILRSNQTADIIVEQ